MVDMRDYDEEDWKKKERLRSIIGKTALSVFLFCPVFLLLISLISAVRTEFTDFGRVVIEDIHNYDIVYPEGIDGDLVIKEGSGTSGYAVIKNNGFTSVNLECWRLNAGDPGEDFYFPSYTLRPGQTCRVYTNEIHLTFCGFSFGITRGIWGFSDCGYLYDDKGVLVDEYCYSWGGYKFEK